MMRIMGTRNDELSECEFDELEMLDNEAVTAEHDVQPK